MCGILGTINISNNNYSNNIKWVRSQINYLFHRGPYAMDIWSSENKKIIFGHTKLSIIDLSDKNNQPMKDDTNKICITISIWP